ncbi:ferritin family protein [Candidatus Woesearchaeota archaeon]|jgi:rubrerythrin|nr:ferritin family protein [Candidatus Woesearchaeota archaeon]MBT6519831.1 ferritin family protein [Candidatus Woesearchaeota archaeon]MBT7366896.1 ferritin family protein [Candidatus Woesearchaeota archaeon]
MNNFIRIIFENALIREESAHRLYTQLAKTANNKIVKELFFKLAEEELVHYRLFSKMAVNVVKIVNEAPLHKLNLLNNFNQNKLTCESCDEIKKAINFAINEEQKAHDDYSVIAKHLDFGDGRDVLEEMARQEMRHKLLLQKVLEKMEKENVAVFSN